MKCRTCKHWTLTDHYESDTVDDEGTCSVHLGIQVSIEIQAGWDGGIVSSVETEESFFCAAYEEKTEE